MTGVPRTAGSSSEIEPDPLDAFESVPCGYVVTDRTGLIVAANQELHRMVGAPTGDLVGRRTLASMLSVAGRIFLETHLWPILEHEGRLREVALDLLRTDGVRVPVLAYAALTPPQPGTPASVRAIFVETRERHRYEQDLLGAKAAAEQARAEAIRLAQTLQQTFVPPPPPDIANLRVAATYRPAGDGTLVGGDFYDLFQVSDRNWMVALGDVSGKGVEAAVVTSFVRHTVRALAIEHTDPAELFELLNRALLRHATDRYCTLVLANLQRSALGWDGRLSLAGHPPALVRQPDARVTALGEPGSAIGLRDDPRFHTVDFSLQTQTLTLYTDGVTDARHDDEFYGEDRLRHLIATLPHDAGGITTGIASTVVDYQEGNASDDIAVMTIQADL